MQVEIQMFETELSMLSVKDALVDLAHLACNLEAEVVLLESKLGLK